jgi:nucleoid DNA-binding protein
MHQYVYKYFALHKNVALPGIGSFSVEMQNAKLDFISKTLHSPTTVIHYNHYDEGDEKFYNFLSKETGLDESDAANRFKHFAIQLKEELERNNILELKGIGVLTNNALGYSFVASDTVQSFFPEVVAERVIRQNAEHTVKVGEYHKTSTQMHKELRRRVVKKDNWHINAAVLAAIGIIAIVLYYLVKK